MSAVAPVRAVTPDARKNGRVALMAIGAALAMLGLGYASVPLYRMFCQATGFGGTTQRATAEKAAAVKVGTKLMTVRFDANVDPRLAWQFRPEQVTQDMKVGERKLATFIARNASNRVITGTASFNVTPEQAGKYFNKIQCFCFTEQRLEPGQEVRMPVIYYVDPAMLNDPDAKSIEEITLSYTFTETKQSMLDAAKAK